MVLTERDSRVYFGKAEINALNLRDTGGTSVQKIMAYNYRVHIRGMILEVLSMSELTAVKIVEFNSTAIRFPEDRDCESMKPGISKYPRASSLLSTVWSTSPDDIVFGREIGGYIYIRLLG